TVSTRKISAATPVDATAKSRVCRLFMAGLRLNADSVPVADTYVDGIEDGDNAEDQNSVANRFENSVKKLRIHEAPSDNSRIVLQELTKRVRDPSGIIDAVARVQSGLFALRCLPCRIDGRRVR